MELTQPRKSTTFKQLEILVAYMEQYKELALGRLRTKGARMMAAKHWVRLTARLNLLGPSRTCKEWPKHWNDLKCRTKLRYLELQKQHSGNGGFLPTVTNFSDIETRVLAIIGCAVDPLLEVAQECTITHDGDSTDSMAVEDKFSAMDDFTPQIESSTLTHRVERSSPQSPLRDYDVDESDEDNKRLNGSYKRQKTVKSEPTPSAGSSLDVRTSRGMSPQPERDTRRRGRRSRQSSTLDDDACATLARVEEITARTNELLAMNLVKQTDIALKQAEASKVHAEALKNFSQATLRIATCFENWARQNMEPEIH